MTKIFDEKQNSRPLPELISLLSNDPDNAYPGGASDQDINELEEELATKLPLEYVQFLKKLGGGNFKHLRIYSIASEDETFSDFMEQGTVCTQCIPLVLSGDLLPFADDYDGNVFCFNLNHTRDGEYEIILWGHEFEEDDQPKHIAFTFKEFLEKIEFDEGEPASTKN
jgi:cell wall assembly regulator SMI1